MKKKLINNIELMSIVMGVDVKEVVDDYDYIRYNLNGEASLDSIAFRLTKGWKLVDSYKIANRCKLLGLKKGYHIMSGPVVDEISGDLFHQAVVANSTSFSGKNSSLKFDYIANMCSNELEAILEVFNWILNKEKGEKNEK